MPPVRHCTPTWSRCVAGWWLTSSRAEVAAGGSNELWARLDAGLLNLMWQPVVPVGDPPWEEAWALGWAVGSYRGHRTLSHSGADPGFGSKLVLVPERRTGVVVLANSNTVPTSAVAAAALDIALADVPLSVISGVTPEELGEGVAAMRAMLPPVVGPVAETLTTSGPDAAGWRSTDWPRSSRPSSTSTTRGSSTPCGERSSCTAQAWSGPSCKCGPSCVRTPPGDPEPIGRQLLRQPVAASGALADPSGSATSAASIHRQKRRIAT
jgi:Beta-lactamase